MKSSDPLRITGEVTYNRQCACPLSAGQCALLVELDSLSAHWAGRFLVGGVLSRGNPRTGHDTEIFRIRPSSLAIVGSAPVIPPGRLVEIRGCEGSLFLLKKSGIVDCPDKGLIRVGVIILERH